MIVTPIKTKIISVQDEIEVILDEYVDDLKDGSILAITSKIISIIEGNIRNHQESKDELIEEEADLYLKTRSGFALTIKDNILIPSAGIDESNSDGKYILWPKDSFASAWKIRNYLADKFKIKNIGVIITDSKTAPLRYGTTGVAIGYCGFQALKDYRGKDDIFGRKMEVTQANYIDALAGASVLVMGEGDEMAPMALIEDLPFIKFDSNSPTEEERENLKILIDEDIYGPLLASVPWKKGRKALILKQ
jgi:putative folate metabolism gamma-glutamate ligase